MTTSPRAIPERLARDIAAAGEGAPHGDPIGTGLALLEAVEERQDREAAFLLLAADAMITSACEEASAAPDPEQALDSVLNRVAEALG